MTTRLFKRVAKVTLWREDVPASSTQYGPNQLKGNRAIEITDLRVKFKIERSLTRSPNTCDVTIYNLSAASRSDLTTRPLSVQLEGGYDGVSRLLFIGDLRYGSSKQDGPDWETLLQVGDGDRPYMYARVNRSYKKGVKPREILSDVASSMGLKLPSNLDKDANLDIPFLYGAASQGVSRDELTRLLAPYGYSWSIQHGSLRVLRDQDVSSTAAYLIDEAHGMIGSPEFSSPPRSKKPPHVNVKVQLYPELVPGDLVTLKSMSMQGNYRIERVRHEGDTYGDEWTTELELSPSSVAATGTQYQSAALAQMQLDLTEFNDNVLATIQDAQNGK